MAKKRAFVKYTKKGKLIPGSLIVTTNGGYPVDGVYKEVSVDLCCNDNNEQDCTPPLFTPIEVHVPLEGDPCFGDYETATWYIYQTIESGIPVVKLVTEIVPPTFSPADAGDYLVPSINKIIIVASGGFIADVIEGCP